MVIVDSLCRSRVGRGIPGGIDDHEIARGSGATSALLTESWGAMTVLIGRQISVIDGRAAVRDAIFAMLD
ncbi:MAG: hypothetical protein ACRD9W_28805, partial [Terriglobia bacterium]